MKSFQFNPGDKITNTDELSQIFTGRIISAIEENGLGYYQISWIHPTNKEQFKMFSQTLVEHFYKLAT